MVAFVGPYPGLPLKAKRARQRRPEGSGRRRRRSSRAMIAGVEAGYGRPALVVVLRLAVHIHSLWYIHTHCE